MFVFCFFYFTPADEGDKANNGRFLIVTGQTVFRGLDRICAEGKNRHVNFIFRPLFSPKEKDPAAFDNFDAHTHAAVETTTQQQHARWRARQTFTLLTNCIAKVFF